LFSGELATGEKMVYSTSDCVPSINNKMRLFAMENAEITQFIIRELGRHRSHNDITTSVCERTGLRWDEAEKVVADVQINHHGEITGRQNKLLIYIGILTVIGGFGLTIWVLAITFQWWSIYFRYLPIPYSINVILLVVGVVTTFGGVFGLMKMKVQK
jgi:hypothetical protein